MSTLFRPRSRREAAPRFREGAIVGVVALAMLAGCGWVGTASPLPTPGASTTPSHQPATLPENASETPAAGTPGPSTASPSVAVGTASPTPRPTARPTPRRTAGPTLTPPAPYKTAALIYHGSRTSKRIALTIDDGYSSAAVLADLAILQEKRVNATWFPVGQVVVEYPATWRAVANAGFPIANHTWDHRNLTLMSYAQSVAEIRRANEEVGATIGQPLLPFVRPYGGNWNQAVLCEARTAGERGVVLWDTTFGDTGSGDLAQLIANAEKGTNGSIILMHANRSLSQQALSAVIDFYRGHGFTFVTLGQLLGIDGPVPYR